MTKNLIKLKLKNINKPLKMSGLRFIVRYDPSGRKDTLLLLNWIGFKEIQDKLKEHIKEKAQEKMTEVISIITTGIISYMNERMP
jgi:hypothetical protein